MNGMVARLPIETKVEIVDGAKRYPAEVRHAMWVPGEGWFYQCTYLQRKYVPPAKDYAVSNLLHSCMV